MSFSFMRLIKEILVQMIEMAGQHLDQYLYQNEELDCYVRDVIAGFWFPLSARQ